MQGRSETNGDGLLPAKSAWEASKRRSTRCNEDSRHGFRVWAPARLRSKEKISGITHIRAHAINVLQVCIVTEPRVHACS
mmetsp:Transcript_12584/g.21995  ORF Transcript_12584/g.21995 Transcript_12584/m.21995 type:complete len:80 (-) Transcript_12584:58-297(-)